MHVRAQEQTHDKTLTYKGLLGLIAQPRQTTAPIIAENLQ